MKRPATGAQFTWVLSAPTTTTHQLQSHSVRVTVVGAGIIGCAVAHELASRGARVHVVDMRGTGHGATQASAGMLAPYIEGHHDSLRRLGVRSLEMYEGFVARASEDAKQSIEFERSGSLQVACSETEMMGLAMSARQLA